MPVSNSSNPVGCRNANASTAPVPPCNGCQSGKVTSARCNGTTSSADKTTDATLRPADEPSRARHIDHLAVTPNAGSGATPRCRSVAVDAGGGAVVRSRRSVRGARDRGYADRRFGSPVPAVSTYVLAELSVVDRHIVHETTSVV